MKIVSFQKQPNATQTNELASKRAISRYVHHILDITATVEELDNATQAKHNRC